jgi:RNA polymerase sigma-70 factor (ECF subfamily)
MKDSDRIRDSELLRRFLAGDRESFAELYRIHSRSVYRFALYLTVNEEKAAELTQDVFVWLVRNPDRYDRERGELGSFLSGVARQILRRRVKEERRWQGLDEKAAAPEKDLPAEHDLARLKRAVAALPLRYREAVVLCELEGKTYQEAAGALECAVGTVRSRLHRARILLTRKFMGSGCLV